MPTVKPPAAWTAPGAGAGAVSDNWLVTFGDDQLTAAVVEAIVHNADLRVGAARVEQALLHAKLAGAKLYPSVDVLARGGGKMSGDSSGLQGAVLTVTWELDLWGRVRYGRAAAAADAASAQAGLRVRPPVHRRAGRQELVPGDRSGPAGRGRARHHPRRRGAGASRRGAIAGSASGTRRTSSSRAPTPARTATRLRQIELARRTGDSCARDPARPISGGRHRCHRAAARPAGAVPAGLPSELLERRPDVVAAERRVAAAFNRVHEAKAARLPAIALTTGVSSISSELFVLQDQRQSDLELRRQPARADLQGRRAQDAGRDPDGGAEAGRRRVCGRRAAGVRRGRERARRRVRRPRARADSRAGAGGQSARARGRADAVQGRQHRSAIRHAAAARAATPPSRRSSACRRNSACSA